MYRLLQVQRKQPHCQSYLRSGSLSRRVLEDNEKGTLEIGVALTFRVLQVTNSSAHTPTDKVNLHSRDAFFFEQGIDTCCNRAFFVEWNPTSPNIG
jgi:hypothetical protein